MKPVKSSKPEANIQATDRGRRENTQVYNWVSSSNTIQIPTFSHSETNAGRFSWAKRKSFLNVNF